MGTAERGKDKIKPPRKQFGFERTRCGCELCRVPCRHIPGFLTVSDLERLCPAGQNLFAWAEEHLRAITDQPFPTLIPTAQGNGHCHWFLDGQCAIHEHSPYGCAFFDAHLSAAESKRRLTPAIKALRTEGEQKGTYYEVWMHLRRKGLVVPSGDRAAMVHEREQIRRDTESAPRRKKR